MQSRQVIDGTLKEIEQLRQSGAFRAGFLLAWATFEAEGRALLERWFDRPQTPGRLVQILSQEGFLVLADADQMRALSEKRNRLIHGDLGIDVSNEDLQCLVSVLRQLQGDDQNQASS